MVAAPWWWTCRSGASYDVETPGPAFTCILSPDSAWLLICAPDGGIHRFFLPEPDAPPDVLPLHDGVCVNSGFHPDSDVLLTSSWDGSIALSGMGEGTRLARHSSGGLYFVWQPDGRRAAWQDATSGELIMAEAAGRSVCRVISLPAPGRAAFQFGCLAFTPDGRHLAVCGADGIRFYETERGSWSGYVPMKAATCVAFPAAETMLVATGSGLVQRAGQQTPDGHIAGAGEKQMLHSGQHPLIVSGDGSTTALMTERGIELRRGGAFQPVPGTAAASNRGFFLSQDGRRLVVRAGTCSVWNTETGQRLCTMPLGGSPCLTGTPPLVVGGHRTETALEAHDAATGAILWRTPLPGLSAGNCTASPDGTLTVAAASDGSLVLVESATGRITAVLQHPDPKLIQHVSFSPDGSKIAAATAAGTVLLWNLPHLRTELAALGLDW